MHEPSFLEKETKPPRNYTEASLLRAMETAGKQVDDDEMCELMKENGIGRPSTRASIIETLFRRKYIERKKKLVIPTQTGIQLIDLIDNELLKSAELTGRWEKRLKEIERGEFNAGTFIKNMKKMVDDLVYEVRSSKKTTRISHTNTLISTEKKVSQKIKSKRQVTGKVCPKCGKGHLLKGKAAFGCSEYKDGCTMMIPFKVHEKKISENQIIRLLDKGSTTNLKGFKTAAGTVEGLLRFDEGFTIQLESKQHVIASEMKQSLTTSEITSSNTPRNEQEKIPCPKCKKGNVLKGKTAYGCSAYKSGCDFIFTFENIKKIAGGRPLTKQLVLEIISN